MALRLDARAPGFDAAFAALGAMLLGELMICLAFLAALGRPIVAWRGARFRVRRGGVIELLP